MHFLCLSNETPECLQKKLKITKHYSCTPVGCSELRDVKRELSAGGDVVDRHRFSCSLCRGTLLLHVHRLRAEPERLGGQEALLEQSCSLLFVSDE